MPSPQDRLVARLDAVRRRRPSVDHTVRTVQHYGAVRGSQWAGAITYFGFLSFFPVLAVAFAVVALLAGVYPEGRDDLVTAINALFPGLIGDEADQISMTALESAARTALGLGLLGLLYAGLGWFSSMRSALAVVFELPDPEQPSFVKGKLRDLLALAVIGAVLLVAVALTGFVAGFSTEVLDYLELDRGLTWLLRIAALAVGLGANAVLFFTLFRLLAAPHVPRRDLWSGAFLGAVGFELLKQLSGELLSLTKDKPAFQLFGVALILLVWINFFSRVVLLAAAWSYQAPRARSARDDLARERARLEELARVDLHEAPPAPPQRAVRARAFAAGGATTLALVAALRRPRRKDSP